MPRRAKLTSAGPAQMPIRRGASRTAHFPLVRSIGASVRLAHREFIQELQAYLAPYDVPVGMWFFFRALWEEDGLTQRELGKRAGTMEPAAVEQLREMERRGFIKRRRSTADRRRIHVYLTPRGRALERELVPIAVRVVDTALAGLTAREVGAARRVLARIRANLQAARAARVSLESSRGRPVRPRRRSPLSTDH